MILAPHQKRGLRAPAIRVTYDASTNTEHQDLRRDEDGLNVLLELARSAPPMPDDYQAFIEPPEDRSADGIVERHATWAVEWACHVYAKAEGKLYERPLPALTTDDEGGTA